MHADGLVCRRIHSNHQQSLISKYTHILLLGRGCWTMKIHQVKNLLLLIL